MITEILFIISLIFGILGIIFYKYGDEIASYSYDLVAWGMLLCCFGWAATITFGLILVIGYD